jgi:hypothetical protein
MDRHLWLGISRLSRSCIFLKTFTHTTSTSYSKRTAYLYTDWATCRKDWALHSSAWWRGGDVINLATFSDTLPTVNFFLRPNMFVPLYVHFAYSGDQDFSDSQSLLRNQISLVSDKLYFAGSCRYSYSTIFPNIIIILIYKILRAYGFIMYACGVRVELCSCPPFYLCVCVCLPSTLKRLNQWTDFHYAVACRPVSV